MKGKASNSKVKAKNKFKPEDKVFAMDGGDLYEAKVRFSLQRTACFDACCCNTRLLAYFVGCWLQLVGKTVSPTIIADSSVSMVV